MAVVAAAGIAVGCRQTGRARAAAGQLVPPEVGPCVSAAGGKINCGRMPGARKKERRKAPNGMATGTDGEGRTREKRENNRSLEW